MNNYIFEQKRCYEKIERFLQSVQEDVKGVTLSRVSKNTGISSSKVKKSLDFMVIQGKLNSISGNQYSFNQQA